MTLLTHQLLPNREAFVLEKSSQVPLVPSHDIIFTALTLSRQPYLTPASGFSQLEDTIFLSSQLKGADHRQRLKLSLWNKWIERYLK